MTQDTFTLRFGLDVAGRAEELSKLDPHLREREFAREQIEILLRYVTLYAGDRRLDPDAFAIANEPDLIFSLKREMDR